MQAGQLERLPKPTLEKLAKAADVPVAATTTKETLIKKILKSPLGKSLTAVGATLSLGAVGLGAHHLNVKRLKELCPWQEGELVTYDNKDYTVHGVNLNKKTVILRDTDMDEKRKTVPCKEIKQNKSAPTNTTTLRKKIKED